MKPFIFVILLFFVPVLKAHAEPVVEIDKIVITESRETPSEYAVEASETIFVKSTRPQTSSVADVLSHTAGIHIQRFGGLEEATSISIRGSENNQVQIVLDDVPIDTASGEGVGLSQMPSTMLSKIEVFKNFTPSEFGGSAVGGVINLKSRDIEKGVHARFGFGFGSFATVDALAELTLGGVDHDWLFGLDFRRTEGDFTFLDNNGTPVNFADDQRVKRQNNEHQVFHPYLKWIYRFDPKTTLKWSQHLFRVDSGVPGLGSSQSASAGLSQTEWLSSLNLKRDGFFSDRVGMSNTLHWHFIKSQFSDPNAEVGLGAAQDNDNTTFVFGDRFYLKSKILENASVKKGIEYVHEWFLPKDYAAAIPVGSASNRVQLNFFVEPEVFLWDKKLRVAAQVQNLNAFYNINNNDASLGSPGTYFSNRTENQFAATGAIDVEPIQNWHIKSSVGRSVRLPKFYELFGDQGSVLGNAQLSSERAIKFDFGSLWMKKYHGFLNEFSVEANYFESHVSDLIQFEVASGFARAGNIGSATVRGGEFSAGTKFGKYFQANLNYTLQRPIDTSVNAGNFLIGRPLHEFNNAWQFDYKNFNAGVSFNFIDRQYLDALNTQVVRKRLLTHAEAGYLFKNKYRVSVQAKNLTDSQLVDAVGFPLPGRSFFGRIDVLY